MTGIRIGEAVELRWKDIDFGHKRLQVRRRLYHGKVAPPKSEQGSRDNVRDVSEPGPRAL